MRNFTFVLWLLIAASAAGQEIKGNKNPELYGFAVLSIDTKGGVLWEVTPMPVQEEQKDNILRFGGKPGVEYIAKAAIVDWDAKKISSVRTVVKFGGVGPDPGPGPMPPGPGPMPPGPGPIPPPPPPPVDEMLSRLQAAADLDPDKAMIPRLIAFYEEAILVVNSQRTWLGLFQALTPIAAKHGTAGRLGILQKAIQLELLKRGIPGSVENANVEMGNSGKLITAQVFGEIVTTLRKVR
jgi:hypothetical protein